MQIPKVSVVIPVYKVEPYICRCVDSVLAQTLPDLEIILVDDGSPDNCPAICDEYAARNENVRVIHKPNGGLASARNAGLRVSKGEYILFIDSDDWIDPNTAEELYGIAQAQQVDFVRFRPMFAGWPNHKDGELCDFGTEKGMTEGLYTRQRIENEIFPGLIASPELSLGLIVSACRSMYRLEFLLDHGLYFDEDVKYSEDSIFSARLVYATNAFYYLDGPRYYHYFFNPGSITKSFRKDRWDSCHRLIARFEEAFSACETFDFSDQLWLQKIYCVMHALSQRDLISNCTERQRYCQEICDDPVTVAAFKHLKLVNVPWKLYILLTIVRFRQGWLLARI